MIQYEPDGVTLSYSATDGAKVSRSPFDGDAYYQLVVIRQAQLTAISDNNAAAVDYHTKLSNFQALIDAGRNASASAPAKPQMRVVDDTGNVSTVPFVPPLPDAVYPVIAPASGSIKSAPAPDRTDVLINLVMALNGKIDRLLAGGK